MTSEGNRPLHSQDSPLWSRGTKTIVVVVALLLIGLLAYRFQGLIVMVALAAVVAYVLNPIVELISERTSLRRSRTILIVFAVLALLVLGGAVALGVAALQQVSTLIRQVPDLISELITLFQLLTLRTEPIVVMGRFEINPRDIPWQTITNQLLGLAEPAISQGGQLVRQVASATFSFLAQFFFVFVISIYLANEFTSLGRYLTRIAEQPGYSYDVERLLSRFGGIWSAYLRGQVLLGIVIGVTVWLGLSTLGVQNALALGLLSGLLEFVPTVGPIVSAVVATLVALLQPGNYFGLEQWAYALIVIGFMVVVQQLENNLLVPRIVGGALELHPLTVIIGVLMGASIAGILGAILAAPVIATLRLLGVYTWRKLFDLDPFPVRQGDRAPPSPSLLVRGRYWLARFARVARRNQ